MFLTNAVTVVALRPVSYNRGEGGRGDWGLGEGSLMEKSRKRERNRERLEVYS